MPWVVDHKHSYVGFAIRHMMMTMVRGSFHRYRADIAINEQDLTRSAFAGEIDVASLDTHNATRDDHLRSAEFFDVARYPTMTYQSTRIEAMGRDSFRVRGDLTLRGTTREVVLEGTYAGTPQSDPWGVRRTGFSAAGQLDRRDFGLIWNVALEAGGLLVGEKVDLNLDLELMVQD